MKPDCLNCMYAFFDTNDKNENLKCKGMVDSYKDYPVNILAQEYLEEMERFGDHASILCRHYQPVKTIKDKISYSLK